MRHKTNNFIENVNRFKSPVINIYWNELKRKQKELKRDRQRGYTSIINKSKRNPDDRKGDIAKK